MLFQCSLSVQCGNRFNGHYALCCMSAITSDVEMLLITFNGILACNFPNLDLALMWFHSVDRTRTWELPIMLNCTMNFTTCTTQKGLALLNCYSCTAFNYPVLLVLCLKSTQRETQNLFSIHWVVELSYFGLIDA